MKTKKLTFKKISIAQLNFQEMESVLAGFSGLCETNLSQCETVCPGNSCNQCGAAGTAASCAMIP